MKLIKAGAYTADTYAAVADDAALPEGAVLVSLARFQKDRDALVARNTPIGVKLQSHENPELLGDDVGHFSLIALEFPKFRDGRAFSWARMLRTRLGFTGEIRAVGDFLYDQVNYQKRVGFDAWEVPDHFTTQQFERALAEMTNVYQPSADGKRTIAQLRAFRAKFGKNDDLSEEELYHKAVAIVVRDRKASTSYIQRQLQIGYNRAASLIERMEQEGVVKGPGRKDVHELG